MRRLAPAQGGIFLYEARGKRWWGVDYLRPTGAAGRKVRFRTKGEAIAFKAERDLELEQWYAGSGRVVFEDALDRYIKDRRAAGKADSSYQYLALWREALGTQELKEITPDHVEELLDRWAEERGWSPATRNRVLAQLSGAFSWFKVRRWITLHPIQGFVVRRREDNARQRWLRPDEIERIREHCPAWLDAIVQVAVLTGMRLGEIVNLRRADYQTDDDRAWLTTQQTKNRRPLVWPLLGQLRELVEERVIGAPFPGSYLFPGPGRGNARSSIRRFLPKAVQAAGLPWGVPDGGVTFHSLRHSFASIARLRGLGEREIAILGNWKDPRMVARYTHLADEQLEAAAAKLADVVKLPRRRSVDFP